MGNGDYRGHLLSELSQRKSKNPLYSLRAFARDLGVSVTALSDVLAAKRHLSKRNVLRVANRLALSPRESARMLEEATGQEVASVSGDALQLEDDTFRLISDWHYFGILNLARLRDCRSDVTWVARRLGISKLATREAITRLKRLGYLADEDGRLRRTALPLQTSSDVPSSALRNHHRQNLARAAEALERVPVSEREISSVTMAFDKARMDEAKQMIVEFRKKFSRKLEGGSGADEVCTLAIQFFPLMESEK